MVGERIRQARLVAGLTQDELAQCLAVQQQPITKAALSKYELNKSTPPARVLMALAHVLGVIPSYFLAEDVVAIQWLAFRKHAQLPQARQDEVKAYAQHVAEQQMELTTLLYPGERPQFPTPHPATTVEDAEHAAEELRRMWGLDDNPIESITQVIEDHGGVVVGIPRPIDHFDGISGWINQDIPLAVTATTGSLDRQRFNVAHEIGHLLLWNDKQDEKTSETIAHRFAASFLLPAHAIRHELGVHRQRIDIGELRLLKQKFGISMQAIIYRAHDLGIITTGICASLFQEFSRRGWRKEEPYPFIGHEAQLRLKQMTLRAFAEKLITRDSAEQLCPGCLADEPPEPVPATGPRVLMQMPLAERNAALEAFAEAFAEDYATNEELRDWTALDGELWDMDGEDWE